MNKTPEKTINESELRANPPKNMNLKEAAVYVGVSQGKLWNETSAKRVRAARVGRRLVFRLVDLEQWLAMLAERSS